MLFKNRNYSYISFVPTDWCDLMRCGIKPFVALKRNTCFGRGKFKYALRNMELYVILVTARRYEVLNTSFIKSLHLPDVNWYFNSFIFTFPTFSHWSLPRLTDGLEFHKTFFFYCCWLLWFVHRYYIMGVLLAPIGGGYEPRWPVVPTGPGYFK